MSLYRTRLIQVTDKQPSCELLNDTILDNVRAEMFIRCQQQRPEILQDLGSHKDELRRIARDIFTEKYPNSYPAQITAVLDELTRDLYGSGPITSLIENPDVMNIWINNHQDIQYEDSSGMHIWPHSFRSENHIRRIAEHMAMSVGRKVDEANPTVDCRLLDGSRVSIMLGPSPSVRGTSITIRRFPKLYTLEDLSKRNMFPEKLTPFFKLLVKARLNIFTAGSMGAGKNTFLSALLLCVGPEENLIFVEDPAESKVGLPDPERPDLPVPHVKVYEPRMANVEGRGEVSLENIFERALRQQPTRIMVSECRSRVTAKYTLHAMGIGHPGSMSSVHADSSQEVPERLAELMGGGRENLIKTMAANIIIYIIGLQMANGYPRHRRILEISEVRRKDGKPEVVTLYEYDFQGFDEAGVPQGELIRTGEYPDFLRGRQVRFMLNKDELATLKTFF